MTMVEMQRTAGQAGEGLPGLDTQSSPHEGSPGTFIHFRLQTTAAKHTSYRFLSARGRQTLCRTEKGDSNQYWKGNSNNSIVFFLPALHPHQAWSAKPEPSCFQPGPHILTIEVCPHSHRREEEGPTSSPLSYHLHWVLLTIPKNAFSWMKPSPPQPHDGFSTQPLPTKKLLLHRWLPRIQKGVLILKTAGVRRAEGARRTAPRHGSDPPPRSRSGGLLRSPSPIHLH